MGARTGTQVLASLAILEDSLAVVAGGRCGAGQPAVGRTSRVLSRIPGRHPEAWSSAREAAALAQRAADPAAEFEALLAQHDLLWTTDGQVTAEGIERRLSLCADLVAGPVTTPAARSRCWPTRFTRPPSSRSVTPRG